MATNIKGPQYEGVNTVQIKSAHDLVGAVSLELYYRNDAARQKGMPEDPDDPRTAHMVTHNSLRRAINKLRSRLHISETIGAVTRIEGLHGPTYVCDCTVESAALGETVVGRGEINAQNVGTEIASNYAMTVLCNRAQDRAYLDLLALDYDRALYSDAEFGARPKVNAESEQPKTPVESTEESAANGLIEISKRNANVRVTETKTLPQEAILQRRKYNMNEILQLQTSETEEAEEVIVVKMEAEEVADEVVEEVIDEEAVETQEMEEVVEELAIVNMEEITDEAMESAMEEPEEETAEMQMIKKLAEVEYLPKELAMANRKKVFRYSSPFGNNCVAEMIELLTNGDSKGEAEFNFYLNRRKEKPENQKIAQIVLTLCAKAGVLYITEDGKYRVKAKEK